MTANEQTANLSKIIKRLELIKTLISLDEETEIESHIIKLKQHAATPEVANILTLLEKKFYSKAIPAIETFINKHHNLTFFNDPEIDALKLEIKILEAEINVLSNEKADLEKLIREFAVRHNKELGELIIRILKHRKDKAKGTPSQQEAEQDYKKYFKEYENSKNEKICILSEEQLKDLKNSYRKASKLCHPDVVSDEQKELATRIFAELSIAYEQNDFKKVKEILHNLEKGNMFITKSDSINTKQLLYAEMEKLRLLIKDLKEQMQAITGSETYKTILGIDDWEEYFADAKEKLQRQLNDLEMKNT